MKLLIDIPKEFEQHFQMDRFEDSLARLGADAHLMAGKYEQELVLMLIKAFETADLVPPQMTHESVDTYAEDTQEEVTDEQVRKYCDSRMLCLVTAEYLSCLVSTSVKKGKWREVMLDQQFFGFRPKAYYCSECQHIATFRTFFCPNCGAKMDDVTQ